MKTLAFIVLFFASNLLSGRVQWVYRNLDPNYFFSKVKFIDSQTGFLIDIFTFLKTTNGGEDWEKKIKVPVGQNSLTKFEIFSDGSGLLIFANGEYWKTYDYGETWSKYTLPIPDYFHYLFALDANRFWLMSQTKNIILYTTNGGDNWDSTLINYFDNFSYITAIFFIDSLKGFITTDKGFILQTNDGGKNWIQKDIGLDKFLNTIYFYNNYLGWVGGFDGTISRTIDAGENWLKISFPVDEAIHKIFFLNDKEGWVFTIVGSGFNSYSKIYYTSDGGSNWSLQLEDTTRIFTGISFIGSKGWICGFYGGLLFTDLETSIENDTKAMIEQERVYLYSDKKSFPNPTSGYVKCKVLWNSYNGAYRIEDAKIEVYSVFGNKIIAPEINIENIQTFEANIVLNCNVFVPGLYFIHITLNNESIAIPIVVTD